MEARPSTFARRPTPEQAQGPFYPLALPPNPGHDLTVVPGKPGRAQGQLIQVAGHVLDTRGSAVAGARVEIWQANTFGRYTHHQDTNPAPLDPNFTGYGLVITDAEGRYQFKTVRPGPYSISDRVMRTRHIHFCITSQSTRLITQMYFAGEPLNEADPLLSRTENKEDLIVTLLPPPPGAERDAMVATWDIVLWEG